MNKPSPFNTKQMNYIAKTFDSWLNVAEGGKRGSKNVVNTYAFCLNLETHPNKIHLIAGVTNSTARINIAVCDGYGIFNYFEGRYREGKFQDRNCIYVNTKVGEKVILIAGGRKNGDEAFIKGFTLGSAYITEANECHLNFLKEVFDRTMSSDRRRIFHDLNPKDPHHYYYEDILNFHEEKQKNDHNYGYNYGHFTIADNMSVSNKKLREVLKTYEKGTVWYRRDILGERAVAEGLVFPYFANNEQEYLIKEEDIKNNYVINRIHIGVDFGDSGSKYSWTAIGFSNRFKTMIVLENGDIKANNTINVDKFCNEFIKFYKLINLKWGQPRKIYCDSASNTLINSLKTFCKNEGLYAEIIQPVKKNEVAERPRLVDLLLRTKRLILNENCRNTRKALRSLVWDEKDCTKPLDENIDNINDDWDSFCYSWINYTKEIEKNR